MTIEAVQLKPAFEALQSVAAVRRWNRDEEICSVNDEASSWYFVIAGIVRQYRLSAEGRRQIVDLLMPGDFFGFVTNRSYAFSAQAAVNETFVARYSRERIEPLADGNPAIGRMIREQSFRTIRRLQEHIVVQGRTTAIEKVAGYLLRMSERVTRRPSGPLVLPVSRYDIADHLGLSVETVCRSMTELKNCGLIALRGPRLVIIMDRTSLEAGKKSGSSELIAPGAVRQADCPIEGCFHEDRQRDQERCREPVEAGSRH